MQNNALIGAYLRQQRELSMPDLIFQPSFDMDAKLNLRRTPGKTVAVTAIRPEKTHNVQTSAYGSTSRTEKSPAKAPQPRPGAPDSHSRLKKVPPLANMVTVTPVNKNENQGSMATTDDGSVLTYDEKRAVLAGMFREKCTKCRLSATRKKFVFGAGVVDARWMIIGDAPGAEDDEQGIPFAGATGALLTELLAEAGIDRKKETFATTVLKCIPLANRPLEKAGIASCLPILERQIAIIRPGALLLLGKTVADVLMGGNEQVAARRSASLSYKNIPAIVTFDVADLVQNPELRPQVLLDLVKLKNVLDTR